jgi:hypothetical protein
MMEKPGTAGMGTMGLEVEVGMAAQQLSAPGFPFF